MDWRAVGEAVRRRREDLGLAQGAGGISAATWRKVEKALDAPYRRSTLAGIARALAWPDDALTQIATGTDPAQLPDKVDGAAPWEVLLSEQRRLTEAVERLADRLEQ